MHRMAGTDQPSQWTDGGVRAAAGDAVFQQVEADMFRMAALFVLERLKPWLLTYLAALLAVCPEVDNGPALRAARLRRGSSIPG